MTSVSKSHHYFIQIHTKKTELQGVDMTPCKSSRYHPFKRRREVIRTRATISVITRCWSLSHVHLKKKLFSLSVEMMMIKGRADKVVVVRLFFLMGIPVCVTPKKSTIYPYVWLAISTVAKLTKTTQWTRLFFVIYITIRRFNFIMTLLLRWIFFFFWKIEDNWATL